FYYIDYCLAQTVSLEFWAMIQDDLKNAWDHYMRYTEQGGSHTFTDLLKNADLASPFDEETLKSVSARAHSFLGAYDLEGIR
ncbi:MAG TPA: M3 family oligoendopeptidase, partial [Erysipelotrichaceae bacterium]|nr:M3 family oligoendopeptidase [Erysipelotrichaceae bacterium]